MINTKNTIEEALKLYAIYDKFCNDWEVHDYWMEHHEPDEKKPPILDSFQEMMCKMYHYLLNKRHEIK